MRVCLCIMMNHPFPRVIPLLRKLYSDRFAKVVFLVPFYKSDDEDIITTYRGSYNHAAYVTDALHDLEKADCDYYVFMHDDVMLNPLIDEANFSSFFPLGPNDGFISLIKPTPHHVAEWAWYFGHIAKTLFPKSLLFGSGVENLTLGSYLPPRDKMIEKFTAAGYPYQSSVTFDSDEGLASGDLSRFSSEIVLNGFSAQLDHSNPKQIAADQLCFQAGSTLVKAMQASTRVTEDKAAEAGAGTHTVELPVPLIMSGHYADFYILPKSKLAEFGHYMGVASAANLFVEIMVPSLLVYCCDKIFTASDFAFDISGFSLTAGYSSLYNFNNPKFITMHPFKLSMVNTPEAESRFLNFMAAMRAGEPYQGDPAIMGLHSVGGNLSPYIAEGWFGGEGWGRWACENNAEIRFFLDPTQAISELMLVCRSPLAGTGQAYTVEVSINDRPPSTITFDGMHPSEAISFTRNELSDGLNVLKIHADRLITPRSINPAYHDDRGLGVGVESLQFI